MSSKIAITGANGFVGTYLQTRFKQQDIEVVAIPRSALKNQKELISLLDGCDTVINLAGANILAKWTMEYKQLLRSSRIDTTKALVDAFSKLETKPKLFISTSAVGIYKNNKKYNEETTSYSDGFLGKLCQEWENEALKANDFGIRTAIFRFGIVLGKKGGALEQMLTPFKFGVGGKIGNGSQAFSYIHIRDLGRAYNFIMDNDKLEGVFNLTAPIPTTNMVLTESLGYALHRPTLFPVPKFVLEFMFGEGASVLTEGQNVVPKRLTEAGFDFKYKTIEQTIQNLVGDR